ncbi:MAG TPA: sugar transferase [Bacteroidetes bacterium]|nr:sugar transferase [Bacteroidota bacterium]
MNRKFGKYHYLAGDYLISMISWTLFFLFRKTQIEAFDFNSTLLKQIFIDPMYIIGVFIIPLLWVILFYIFNSYKDVFRKSRLKEARNCFTISLAGSLILFFAILLDDIIYHYSFYYKTFLALFTLQFIPILFWRFIITAYTKHLIKNNKVLFNTIFIGGSEKAVNTYNEIKHNSIGLGYCFLGFIKINGNNSPLKNELDCLGDLDILDEIIIDKKIEEVIIAINSSEHDKLQDILLLLANHSIVIKITPDIYDIITGSVNINNVFGTPLIELYPDLMSKWQQLIKRSIDITGSLTFLILFSPLYLYIAIKVKRSSNGPVFYFQDRIGKNGKVFKIIKFRSMYLDSESDGPALTSTNDNRITPWGKIMRQLRLDELPQFWNVLIGEMSLVGPRPERQFFIDKIMKHSTHYRFLHKVRPGITSLGQVKFGYASDINQMLQRLKFDILYIKNMSLALDFKVMFYTVFTIINKRGQ